MTNKTKSMFVFFTGLASLALPMAAYAGSAPNPEVSALIERFKAEASRNDPSAGAFSAEAGKKLFFSTRVHSSDGKKRGCTTCHTENPSNAGRTQVGKRIEPISPAVNPERFTDPKQIEKWFKRNCKWVLERECTPVEKGNFITFMLSL